MAGRFVDTLRSLDDRRTGSLWLVPALALLCAWLAWLFAARVSVYASTQRARLEVSRMVYHVMAAEPGRIVRTRCELGLWVEQGEVLVELDDRAERAQAATLEAELSGLAARSAALRAEIGAAQARRGARLRLDRVATEQAGLAVAQARTSAAYRRELAAVHSELLHHDLVSRVDALSAGVDAEQSRLRVEDSTLEVARFRATQDYQDKAELFQLAELTRALTELEAASATKQAEAARVRMQLEQRKLRAPARGRLGHILPSKVGDIAKPAEILATVVPEEDVRVVAEFKPDEAAGRILTGQPARVRLSGFSWIEYGMMEAQVLRVASEPDHDAIRVELALRGVHASRIPVQHGLPGQVDVEVERATPWSIATRSLGALLAHPEPRPPLQLARRSESDSEPGGESGGEP